MACECDNGLCCFFDARCVYKYTPLNSDSGDSTNESIENVHDYFRNYLGDCYDAFCAAFNAGEFTAKENDMITKYSSWLTYADWLIWNGGVTHMQRVLKDKGTATTAADSTIEGLKINADNKVKSFESRFEKFVKENYPDCFETCESTNKTSNCACENECRCGACDSSENFGFESFDVL